MRKRNNILFAVLLVVIIAGCATRDNTDFVFFYIQTDILAEETLKAVESAIALEETNQIEAISHGDHALLERVILHRESIFSLQPDSSTLLSALRIAKEKAEFSSNSLELYALLLSELTGSNDLAFNLSSTLETPLGVFGSVLGVLIEQGRVEYDTERIQQAMLNASPAIDSISTAMAALVIGTANSVQASYSDMTERRQRDLITGGFPLEGAEELFLLNMLASELLARLEILHSSWTDVPVIHGELMISLSETSRSLSLKILAERLIEVREGLK